MNNALVAGLKGGARLKKAQLGGGAKKPGLGGMIQRARSAGVNKAAVSNAAPKKSGMTGMVANAVASQARNKAAKPQSPNRGYIKTQTAPPRNRAAGKRMGPAKRKPTQPTAQPTTGPKPRLGW